ncbi:MAG: 5'-deoxynucleotidase [Ruminococcus sp.]|nr:5'-deoxynucleotidase [Ruminococcus sp.]
MNRFYAMISRMKYIDRWGLMNNTRTENISEHSLETAILAHALVTIANVRLGEDLDADRAAVIGMFHDAGEIITGDMPTPIKYYNPAIKDAYKAVEKVAEDRLVSMLPDDLQEIYRPVISNDDEVLERYVKAADKISALIKCIEEVRMGNNEFQKAKESTEKMIEEMRLPALDIFMKECMPAYYLTLDELG